jgi:hypothetical protein
MSAKIKYKEGTQYGSGGCWHRDSFSKQIKSIAYLTDMTEKNGPFMYIKKSHKMKSILKSIFLLKRGTFVGNQRYSDSEIESVKKIFKEDVTYFPCGKGTLILADIRGLHTTRFLKGGYAYSIFNYYIAKFDNSKRSEIIQLALKNTKEKAL